MSKARVNEDLLTHSLRRKSIEKTLLQTDFPQLMDKELAYLGKKQSGFGFKRITSKYMILICHRNLKQEPILATR